MKYLKNKRSGIRRVLLGAPSLCVLGLGVAPAAFAQEGVFTDQIVVTAQKRQQNIQDVGISITALSGDQMRALGLTNAQEVTAMAAGVSTLQPNGEANYAIGIRGVANNDFTTNVESPVAIYVDETYISQMSGAGFLLFDIDRVEILRGPQGTLFGRNATGGLVHYITVKPSDEFGGYGSVTYGSFDRVKAQGAVNLPVAKDLDARISFATHQGDGYVTNKLNPQEKLNNANETAGRIQLLYKPTDDFKLLLNARMGKQDIRTGFFKYASAIYPDGMYTPGVPNVDLGGYVDNDPNIYTGEYDFTGRNKLDTWGASGRIDWNLGFGTLTTLTDYQSVKRDYMEDSDASPVDYFRFFLTTDATQFSQEARLAGEIDRLKWLVGIYYLDLDIHDSNGGVTIGLFNGLFAPDTVDTLGFNGVRNPYHTTSKSVSGFGQLEYALTDQLSIIGGARYIDERKTHDYRNLLSWFPDGNRSGLDPNIVDVVDAVTPYSGKRHDKQWAFRAQINFKPVESLLTYVSWNRGTKAGGFNAPLLPTPAYVSDTFMNYRPEQLDAYEAGFKLTFANGRARLNGAGYYYDYKDYQAFSIIGLDTFTLNAKARTKGFELEMQATPTQGFDMQFGVAYIDAKVKNVPGLTIDALTGLPAPDDIVPAVIPGATVRPVQTPKWNLNGLARYEFPIGYGNLALQIDGQYRTKHYFTLLATQGSTQDGYFVGDAAITWIPPSENWSVRVFMQNMTASKYLVQTFDLSGNLTNGGLFGLIEQYYGRPRMWGVNVSYQF
ncbi:MAG: TonB-dependent receptor plug domain-containing protein [Alphaproteobacteria bacterium]|nr:TonB-dependent receptor plug domain-containing protein [Alphaproteobacteria bacterium]